MKHVAALAVAGLALALSSCGSADPDTAADPGDPSSQPTSQTTPASSPTSTEPVPLPACKDVWVAKAKLPGDYVGCTKGAKRVEAQQVMCESSQVIVTYAGRFYAVPGRVINDVGHLGKQYQSAMASCQG